MIRALLGLLGVCLGLGALLLSLLGLGETLRAERIERESVLYFVLAPEGAPVRMGLPSGASSVRLETMPVFPAALTPDPDAVFPYGLGVTVLDEAGSALLTQEIQQETRISSAATLQEGEDGSPRWARALLRDPAKQLADNRVVRLEVPEEARARRTLEVQLLPGLSGPVLLRAYAQRALAPWEQTFRARALGRQQALRLSEVLSWRPWQLFSPPEREAILAHTWMRLAADGREGRDFQVTPVWFTGMNAPPQSVPSPGRFFLSPARDAALTLRGSGTLVLERSDALEGVPPAWTPELAPAESVAVHFASAREGMASAPLTCHFPQNGARCTLPVSFLEATTLTFQVENGRYLGLKYLLTDPLRQVGDALAAPADPGLLQVEPDVRTLLAWRVAPEEAPLTVRLRHPTGDVVSVVARVRLPPAFAPVDEQAQVPRLTLELLRPDGAVASRLLCEVLALPSRFEFYREVWQGTYRVGERQVCHVPYTAEVASLSIRASMPVDVQLYERVPWITQEAWDFPYLLPEQAALRWRYAPLRVRRWEPIQPEDVEALWQAGRATRIAAQVRLSAPGSGPGSPGQARPARGMSIKPLSDPRQQELLEPVAAAQLESIKAQTADITNVDGLLVALPHGREVLVRMAGGPLRLLHRLPTESVGETAWLEVDAMRRPAQGVLARSGSLPMGSARAGVRRLLLHAPPGQWLLEGESLSAELPVFKRKRVWALTREEPLKVQIPIKQDSRTVRAEVFVSAQASRPVLLESRLDGGKLRQTTTTWQGASTRVVQQHVIPLTTGAPRGLLDRLDARLRPGVKLAHRLGTDLAPGTHTLELRLRSGPQEVWVRFFVLDEAAEPSEARQVAQRSLAW